MFRAVPSTPTQLRQTTRTLDLKVCSRNRFRTSQQSVLEPQRRFDTCHTFNCLSTLQNPAEFLQLATGDIQFSGCPSVHPCVCVITYWKLVSTISYKPLETVSPNLRLRCSWEQRWTGTYISMSEGQRSRSQRKQMHFFSESILDDGSRWEPSSFKLLWLGGLLA